MFDPPDQPDAAHHDERRLTAARNGSADALGELLETCRQYLLLIANQELDADLKGKLGGSDLVQETMLEAQRDFRRFDGHSPEELRAWLKSILFNNLRNLMRFHCLVDRRAVGREVPLMARADQFLQQKSAGNAQSPPEQMVAQERDAALHRALERLPETERQVIHWRNYDRFSFEEIGQRLGRSKEAARKVWTRALRQLQRKLGDSHEFP